MPYCTKCGHEVRDHDRFCRRCGAPQPAPQAAEPGREAALSPRGASILCYVPWLGWIAAVYVLASDRFRTLRDVRFHAYQGLYLFVAWMLAHWAVGLWMRMILKVPLDALLEIALLVLWIFMLIKTSRGEKHSLPVIGELAERSL